MPESCANLCKTSARVNDSSRVFGSTPLYEAGSPLTFAVINRRHTIWQSEKLKQTKRQSFSLWGDMGTIERLLSVEEALIHVMVMVSAADSAMSDAELRQLGDIVGILPVFKDFDDNNLIKITQQCAERLSGENGMNATLALVAESLPTKLHDTAYALGVEIAAADLRVSPEEVRMLQLLRDHLKLDKLTIAAIERGAQARFRTQ
ncbi:Tellurite resistance protein TerB [Pseudovibrio sp. Ad37]|nr:Tellurite resistance protein TerB [Pseudovibrio sp. Ad37]